jgi:hypothetical protein
LSSHAVQLLDRVALSGRVDWLASQDRVRVFVLHEGVLHEFCVGLPQFADPLPHLVVVLLLAGVLFGLKQRALAPRACKCFLHEFVVELGNFV